MFDGRVYPTGEVEYKVTATVRTWKLDGAPAAGGTSWVCIAEGAVDVLGNVTNKTGNHYPHRRVRVIRHRRAE
jgi:hypothetical protein